MTTAITAQEELELLELLEEQHRDRARTSLDDYCRYIEIPGAPMVEDSCPDGDDCDDPKCTLHEVSNAFYPDTVEPALHHSLLNESLEEINAGTLKRLMVFMPPGSAKSTYVSVTFPTWFMGKNPGKNIISTSYGSTLSKKFGRKCRTITSSRQYDELFGAQLNKENRAVDDWSLTNGSTFMCGGILSGITGNRADGLVIDDPIKGREDADSETIREKTWEAYLTDLRTRLKPNGWITIVQTRWHEDDLSGRILPDDWDGQSGDIEAKDGEIWRVICLPAQCTQEGDPLGREIGDWLWTEWFSVEHWERERSIQGSRNWAALYQQSPKPAEGALILREWPQRFVTQPGEFIRIIQSWDTAYKDKEINDPSVCTTWGQTRHGYYLLDVFRDRLKYPDVKRAVVSLAMSWDPHAVLIEDKASGQSLIQELRAGIPVGAPDKYGDSELFTPPVIAIEPGANKTDRLVATSSIWEAGLVHLPESAPWMLDFEMELFGFPLVSHDDQVDSVSQALTYMHDNRVLVSHHATGVQRIGLQEMAAQTINQDDDSFDIGVRSENDFGGFL